ncbi:MAG: hypothetical protein PUC32_04360 [Oscillospiraceae bacterium]|nr:hypothetical protein [Oscillospiraceae bacterium]
MIRGINKQIVEVKDTDNRYYESAYLVVKPEFASVERAILEREARRLVRSMDAPSSIKPRFGKLSPWLRLLFPALLGAGIATLVVCAILL